MDEISQKSLDLHYALHGKIEVIARKHVETREDLSLLYTPGVAQPCREIQADYDKSFDLTRRSNLVAVITDGSAVLGQMCIRDRPSTAWLFPFSLTIS